MPTALVTHDPPCLQITEIISLELASLVSLVFVDAMQLAEVFEVCERGWHRRHLTSPTLERVSIRSTHTHTVQRDQSDALTLGLHGAHCRQTR